MASTDAASKASSRLRLLQRAMLMVGFVVLLAIDRPGDGGGVVEAAEAVYAVEEAHVLTSVAGGAAGVAVSDVDVDGDMDVLVAAPDDEAVLLFLNDQNNTFSEKVVVTDTAGSVLAVDVAAADLDGDTDGDIAVVAFDNDSVIWFEDQGDAIYTAHVVDSTLSGAIAVLTADIDGDQNMDIVAAGYTNGTIRWYDNGGGQSFAARDLPVTVRGVRSIAAIDGDSDSDIDLFAVGELDDSIWWFANDGSGLEMFAIVLATVSMGAPWSVYPQDMNSDGDVDVVVALHDADAIVWFQLDPLAADDYYFDNSTVMTNISTQIDGPSSVVAVDVDGDSDIDVVATAESGGTVNWFRNDGNGSFTRITLTSDAPTAWAVVATDLDGDSDVDVLATTSGSDTVIWFEMENRSSTETPTWSPSRSPSHSPTWSPSSTPSEYPSVLPSPVPSSEPSAGPSLSPTTDPSAFPTADPSLSPTMQPTTSPSVIPSTHPTAFPTAQPSIVPTTLPSLLPSQAPTSLPSRAPTQAPTVLPSVDPTQAPSALPSMAPSSLPSKAPSAEPSTAHPTPSPTLAPTRSPSNLPTALPTQWPSARPSMAPSMVPTILPTPQPTSWPTPSPTVECCECIAVRNLTDIPSAAPSAYPSAFPTVFPTDAPSIQPTLHPTAAPTTRRPTMFPSTASPTFAPTLGALNTANLTIVLKWVTETRAKFTVSLDHNGTVSVLVHQGDTRSSFADAFNNGTQYALLGNREEQVFVNLSVAGDAPELFTIQFTAQYDPDAAPPTGTVNTIHRLLSVDQTSPILNVSIVDTTLSAIGLELRASEDALVCCAAAPTGSSATVNIITLSVPDNVAVACTNVSASTGASDFTALTIRGVTSATVVDVHCAARDFAITGKNIALLPNVTVGLAMPESLVVTSPSTAMPNMAVLSAPYEPCDAHVSSSAAARRELCTLRSAIAYCEHYAPIYNFTCVIQVAANVSSFDFSHDDTPRPLTFSSGADIILEPTASFANASAASSSSSSSSSSFTQLVHASSLSVAYGGNGKGVADDLLVRSAHRPVLSSSYIHGRADRPLAEATELVRSRILQNSANSLSLVPGALTLASVRIIVNGSTSVLLSNTSLTGNTHDGAVAVALGSNGQLTLANGDISSDVQGDTPLIEASDGSALVVRAAVVSVQDSSVATSSGLLLNLGPTASATFTSSNVTVTHTPPNSSALIHATDASLLHWSDVIAGFGANVSSSGSFAWINFTGDALVLDEATLSGASVAVVVPDAGTEVTVRNAEVTGDVSVASSVQSCSDDSSVCANNTDCTDTTLGVECVCFDGWIGDPIEDGCSLPPGQLEINPSTITLSVTKPSPVNASLVLANTGDTSLEGSITETNNTQNISVEFTFASRGLSQDDWILQACDVERVTITVASDGVRPGTHSISYEIESNSDGGLETIGIDVLVSSSIDMSTSVVELVNTSQTAVIEGTEVVLATFVPFDADDFWITTSVIDETMTATLSLNDTAISTGVTVSCTVIFASSIFKFEVSCTLVNNQAGWHRLYLTAGDLSYEEEPLLIFVSCVEPFVESQGQCVCPEGYRFSSSNDACVLCESGTYSATASLEGSCTECVDPVMATFAPATSAEDCLCPASRYLDFNLTSCDKCPEGVVCTNVGNTVRELELKSGYWRVHENSSNIHPCLVSKACDGGQVTGDAVCSGGQKDALCAVCDGGYYSASNSSPCQSCNSANIEPATIVIVILIVLIVVLVIVYHSSDIGELVEETMMMASSLRTKAKILLTMFQILLSFAWVFDVQFPGTFVRWLRIMSWVNLADLVQILPFSCLVSKDFFHELVVMTLAPIAVSLIILLCYLISCLLDSSKWVQHRIRYSQAFLILTFLVFPSVSAKVFSAFVCHDLGDGLRFMSADYSVSCKSAHYDRIVIYASFFLLVYPIGIPLMYFTLLFRNRHDLNRFPDDQERSFEWREEQEHVRPLGFLYENYRPSRWYWEVFECFRRLALAGALVFLWAGSSQQVVVAIFIALGSMKSYQFWQPYEFHEDNVLAELTSWSIFFTLFTALLIVTEAMDEESSAGTAMGLLLVALTVLTLIFALLALRQRWRKLTAELAEHAQTTKKKFRKTFFGMESSQSSWDEKSVSKGGGAAAAAKAAAAADDYLSDEDAPEDDDDHSSVDTDDRERMARLNSVDEYVPPKLGDLGRRELLVPSSSVRVRAWDTQAVEDAGAAAMNAPDKSRSRPTRSQSQYGAFHRASSTMLPHKEITAASIVGSAAFRVALPPSRLEELPRVPIPSSVAHAHHSSNNAGGGDEYGGAEQLPGEAETDGGGASDGGNESDPALADMMRLMRATPRGQPQQESGSKQQAQTKKRKKKKKSAKMEIEVQSVSSASGNDDDRREDKMTPGTIDSSKPGELARPADSDEESKDTVPSSLQSALSPAFSQQSTPSRMTRTERPRGIDVQRELERWDSSMPDDDEEKSDGGPISFPERQDDADAAAASVAFSLADELSVTSAGTEDTRRKKKKKKKQASGSQSPTPASNAAESGQKRKKKRRPPASSDKRSATATSETAEDVPAAAGSAIASGAGAPRAPTLSPPPTPASMAASEEATPTTAQSSSDAKRELRRKASRKASRRRHSSGNISQEVEEALSPRTASQGDSGGDAVAPADASGGSSARRKKKKKRRSSASAMDSAVASALARELQEPGPETAAPAPAPAPASDGDTSAIAVSPKSATTHEL